MIVSTVLDCLSLEAGEAIPATKGRLTAVFKRSSGFKGKFGWSVQSGKLTDGQNEIGVVFWNKPDLTNLKGKLIYLVSGNDDQGNPTGLMKEISSSKDPKYDGLAQIKVDKEAEVTVKPPVGQENNDNPELDSQEPPQQEHKQEAPQSPVEKPVMFLKDLDSFPRRARSRSRCIHLY